METNGHFNNLHKINYPEILINWYGDEKIREKYNNAISLDIERLSSNALAEKFRNWMNLPQIPLESFKNKIIDLPNNLNAVCGIRFVGGNSKRPFVDIIARNFKLTRETILNLKTIALDEYKIFNPETIRIFFPNQEDIEITESKTDLWLIAGQTKYLIKSPDKIRLVKPKDLSFFDEFKKEYKKLIKSSKNPSIFYPCSREDFEAAMADGHVRIWQEDNKICGLIASIPSHEFAPNAHTILEEFIYEHKRGKGLGKWFQLSFMNEIAKLGVSHIIGTIDDSNKPSLKTALGTGRVCIGKWEFL